MFWKNWPYWLKGGIIMNAIMAILIVLFYCLERLGFISIDISFLVTFLSFIPGAFLISPFLGGWSCFNMDGPCSIIVSNNIRTILIIVSNIIAYFIIGAVVGLIYGKIKNKNIIKK